MISGRRTLTLAALAATLGAVAAPTLAAAADWTKLGTRAYASSLPVASLRLSAGAVQTAWVVPQPGGDFVEGSTFTPTIAGAGRKPQNIDILTQWSQLASDPVLLPGTNSLLFNGFHSLDTPNPLNGDNVTTFAPASANDPSFSATPRFPAGLQRSGTDDGVRDAIVGPGGATYVVTDSSGGLRVHKVVLPAPATPVKSDLATEVGAGYTFYAPRFGTAGGRYWLAWYSLATPPKQSGLYVAEVNLANVGAGPVLVGAPALVPKSASIDNSGLHIAFACGPQQCRIVYHETGANDLDTGRILSWSPTGGGPVTAVGGADPASNMDAAYRADGKLWIAWYGRSGAGSYRYTLGDATGAGGAVGDLGTPPRTSLSSGYGISTVDVGGNLALVTNWAQKDAENQWATVAAPPSSAGTPDTSGIPSPKVIRKGPAIFVVPKKPSLATLRKTKCVNVRVQSTVPAAVNVAIFSGRKSVRIFGQQVVRFTVPGKKLVCIRVPLRARTFDVRQPFRFAFAYKLGAHPKPKDKATVTTSGFTTFK